LVKNGPGEIFSLQYFKALLVGSLKEYPT